MTFMRAGCDVPPSRVALLGAAMDIASGFESGGFANYVWYHCQLSVAAEQLWNTRGVDGAAGAAGGRSRRRR